MIPLAEHTRGLTDAIYFRDYEALDRIANAIMKKLGWEGLSSMLGDITHSSEFFTLEEEGGLRKEFISAGAKRDAIIHLLGLEATGGIDGDMLVLFSGIKAKNLAQLRKEAHSRAFDLLKGQFQSGNTFFIDIDRLSASEFAVLGLDVIEARNREIQDLQGKITPSKILGTYYGFQMLTAGAIAGETTRSGVAESLEHLGRLLAEWGSVADLKKQFGRRPTVYDKAFSKCSSEYGYLLGDCARLHFRTSYGRSSPWYGRAESVGSRGGSLVVDLLKGYADALTEDAAKLAMFQGLVNAGSTEVVEDLLSLYEAGFQPKKTLAAIGRVHSNRSAEILISQLQDKRNRIIAIQALGRNRWTQALGHLVKMFDNEPKSKMQWPILSELIVAIANLGTSGLNALAERRTRVCEVLANTDTPAQLITVLHQVSDIGSEPPHEEYVSAVHSALLKASESRARWNTSSESGSRRSRRQRKPPEDHIQILRMLKMYHYPHDGISEPLWGANLQTALLASLNRDFIDDAWEILYLCPMLLEGTVFFNRVFEAIKHDLRNIPLQPEFIRHFPRSQYLLTHSKFKRLAEQVEPIAAHRMQVFLDASHTSKEASLHIPARDPFYAIEDLRDVSPLLRTKAMKSVAVQMLDEFESKQSNSSGYRSGELWRYTLSKFPELLEDEGVCSAIVRMLDRLGAWQCHLAAHIESKAFRALVEPRMDDLVKAQLGFYNSMKNMKVISDDTLKWLKKKLLRHIPESSNLLDVIFQLNDLSLLDDPALARALKKRSRDIAGELRQLKHLGSRGDRRIGIADNVERILKIPGIAENTDIQRAIAHLVKEDDSWSFSWFEKLLPHNALITSKVVIDAIADQCQTSSNMASRAWVIPRIRELPHPKAAYEEFKNQVLSGKDIMFREELQKAILNEFFASADEAEILTLFDTLHESQLRFSSNQIDLIPGILVRNSRLLEMKGVLSYLAKRILDAEISKEALRDALGLEDIIGRRDLQKYLIEGILGKGTEKFSAPSTRHTGIKESFRYSAERGRVLFALSGDLGLSGESRAKFIQRIIGALLKAHSLHPDEFNYHGTIQAIAENDVLSSDVRVQGLVATRIRSIRDLRGAFVNAICASRNLLSSQVIQDAFDSRRDEVLASIKYWWQAEYGSLGTFMTAYRGSPRYDIDILAGILNLVNRVDAWKNDSAIRKEVRTALLLWPFLKHRRETVSLDNVRLSS